jgi:hypothetical protein
MNIPHRRTGAYREFRRIRERGMRTSGGEKNEEFPHGFNKNGKGKINYNPQLGWVPYNPARGKTAGIHYEHSTAYLRRHDGLPGSRP